MDFWGHLEQMTHNKMPLKVMESEKNNDFYHLNNVVIEEKDMSFVCIIRTIYFVRMHNL